jgi:hypothetical protein
MLRACTVHNFFVSLQKFIAMNPILIYPPDSTRAKFISEAAEYSGARVMKFSKLQAELLDDVLFGNSIEEGMKTPTVSREQIFKTLRKCK